MTSYVNVEILGRLRRDIGRLDTLLLNLEEIEDDETREELEGFDRKLREYRKSLWKSLARIEKEMVSK